MVVIPISGFPLFFFQVGSGVLAPKIAASCIAQELLWTDLQIEFFYQQKGVYFMENEVVNIEFVDEKWSIEICDVSLISFKKTEI